MQACHEAINDGEGLVHQWRMTQLKRLGIPGRGVQGGHAELVVRGADRCTFGAVLARSESALYG
jgi:hypothetical protein